MSVFEQIIIFEIKAAPFALKGYEAILICPLDDGSCGLGGFFVWILPSKPTMGSGLNFFQREQQTRPKDRGDYT